MGTQKEFYAKNGIVTPGNVVVSNITTSADSITGSVKISGGVGINCTNTTTEPSRGISLVNTCNPTTEVTNLQFGINVQNTSATECSQNISYLIGSQSSAYHRGTGTVTNLIGAIGASYGMSTAGNVTSARSYLAQFGNLTSGGTVTSAYGLYGQFYATGTVTNAYGVYLENISGATTNNYAFYSNLGKVHIGDQTDITVTRTDTNGLTAAVTSNLVVNPSSSSSNASFSVWSHAESSETCSQNITGELNSVFSEVINKCTGYVNLVSGITSNAYNYATSGEIEQLASVNANWGSRAVGGVVNASFAFLASSPKVVGTVNNLYGLYLSNISGATTNNYAIYTNAGKVRIGDTTSSTTSTTGAEVISGGLGVGENINAAGYVKGDSLKTGNATIKYNATSNTLDFIFV